MSDNVVPFARPTPDAAAAHGELLYSIDLYDTPGHNDLVVRRLDGIDVDLPDVLTRLNNAFVVLYEDRYNQTHSDEDRLMLTLRVFASAHVSVRWSDDDLLTSSGLAWIRHRLAAGYWSLDRRHSVAYYWHRASIWLRNFRAQPKDTEK